MGQTSLHQEVDPYTTWWQKTSCESRHSDHRSLLGPSQNIPQTRTPEGWISDPDEKDPRCPMDLLVQQEERMDFDRYHAEGCDPEQSAHRAKRSSCFACVPLRLHLSKLLHTSFSFIHSFHLPAPTCLLQLQPCLQNKFLHTTYFKFWLT